MLCHIAKHLSASNIQLDTQYGFRVKLSTLTLLIPSCHDLATAIQSPGKFDVAFLCFGKAFNKAPA